MQKKSIKNYFLIALLLSVVIGIMIHFQKVAVLLFGDGHHHGRIIVDISHMTLEISITVIVAFLMFALNFYILKPLEKHNKLKTLTIFASIVLTVVSVFILNDLLFSLLNKLDPEPRTREFHNEFIYSNFFVSGLVIGCVLIIRLLNLKQSIQIENESLKSKALQSQFESLKNQLSPHFLFNSLTALKTLISESPPTAQNYVNNLSKALRYTLQSNEKKLVTLKEELEFTESYLFLIKMRFDTNLTVNIETDEKFLSYMLPPLTLQTLVENAVKHNEVSKRKPLTLTIKTTKNESLVVQNSIQAKITQEDGTGIGLTNLAKQFQLILGKEINISKENNEFKVEIPLIKA